MSHARNGEKHSAPNARSHLVEKRLSRKVEEAKVLSYLSASALNEKPAPWSEDPADATHAYDQPLPLLLAERHLPTPGSPLFTAISHKAP